MPYKIFKRRAVAGCQPARGLITTVTLGRVPQAEVWKAFPLGSLRDGLLA